MRAWELYETDFQELGIYDPALDRLGRRHPSDTCNRGITLQLLNKLKHIRRRRQKELDKKLALVRTMYGNTDIREFELEQQEQELETLRGQIELEIDAAKIDGKHKDRIRDMAMDAMRRERKR